MIIPTLTKDFHRMDIYNKKRVLSQFFGHKVNQIVSGSLTGGRCGDFQVRHDTYAYSKLRISTTNDGYMHITIWNFEKEKWQEEAE